MKFTNLHTPQKTEIVIGCGIPAETVSVGNVGTNFREQFTASGSEANFASRIKAYALQTVCDEIRNESEKLTGVAITEIIKRAG